MSFVPNRGLSALPPPSDVDLFFDIEGDPFAFWEGLEYLFGVWDGAQYRELWAMDRDAEKHQFQQVMDLFYEHWKQHPDMHIYHYGVYEPSRLKQLAGRHATRRSSSTTCSRPGVRGPVSVSSGRACVVGSERYSIKNLEPLYGFKREIELRDANSSIVEFERILEIGDPGGRVEDQHRGLQQGRLRLHGAAARLAGGTTGRSRATVRRGAAAPAEGARAAPKPPTEWGIRLAGRPRTPDGAADRPIPWRSKRTRMPRRPGCVAHLLDWHRREDKAAWWRFFELITLADDELFQEQEPIAHLQLGGRGRRDQDRRRRSIGTRSRPGAQGRQRRSLYDPRLPPFEEGDLGNGVIDKDKLTLELTRPPEWDGSIRHLWCRTTASQSTGCRPRSRGSATGSSNTASVANPEYRAARDLITGQAAARQLGTWTGRELYDTDRRRRQCRRATARAQLDATTLAIQGPPGSGKTYSGARMILELVRDGRRVGVTGSSHKVDGQPARRGVGRRAEEARPAHPPEGGRRR